MTAPSQENVGRYARSVESGWLGKIIAVEGEFYKMTGVETLCLMIAGGSPEDWLCEDDTQWFVPDDLKFV